MCLAIRWYLVHENKVRAGELASRESDGEEDAIETGDGLVRVDERDLDKTDRENLKFEYPL